MTEKANPKDRELAENTGNTGNTGNTEENAPVHEASRAFDELRRTVARLRAVDGCPWDRAQTHDTLKPACVEEAAEVVCGINILRETGKPESLVEELGDLLLQVIMHAQIGEEEGLFSLTDVIDCVNEKMIRRHPHVFGEKSLEAIRRLREKRENQPSAQEHRFPVQSSIKDDQGEEQSDTQERCFFAGAESGPESGPISGPISGPESGSESGFRSGDSQDEIKADWKYIKSLEKQGREWEEPYLFEAFDEAEKLIDVARERKKRKS